MQTFFKPFLPLLFLAAFTYAQNCYYPNGELAQGDGPCYTTDGTCCPYQWQCLSNGLCYLDNENYYGRYTCTDQSWQSSSCPNYCTNGGTAPGNEALLLCADGSWCCDGDRSFNCCTTAGTDHFRLPQGSPISLILDVPSAMPEASSASSQQQTSTSAPASTFSSSPSTHAPAFTTTSSGGGISSQEPSSATSQASQVSQASQMPSSTMSTMTSRALTTNNNGQVSTIVVVSTVAAAGGTDIAAATSNRKGESNLGTIVGLAVGVPVFIILAAFLAFFVWKHRESRQSPQPNGSEKYSSMEDKFGYQVGHVPPDGRAPEIDSFPVTTGRTKSNRRSELDGSSSSPHSPAVSSVTTPNGPYQGYSSITPTTHTVSMEPAELWGGYVPYRPLRNDIPEEDVKTRDQP